MLPLLCLCLPSLRRLSPRVCFRLYVPEFTSSLSVSVADCSSGDEAGGADCSLVLSIGSVSLQHDPVTVNCSGTTCTAALSSPPWDTWLRVHVESGRDNRSVTFTVVSNYTGGHTNLKQRETLHVTASDHTCLLQWAASQQAWAWLQMTTSASSVATSAAPTRARRPTPRWLRAWKPSAISPHRFWHQRVCGTSPCCKRSWMFCRFGSLPSTGPTSALHTHTLRFSATHCTHKPLVVH